MGTHETDMNQCGRSDSPFRGGERRDRSRSPSPPARDISSLHSCELPESKDATIARLRAELQKIKAVPHEMETELQNEREAHRRTKEQLTREQEKNAKLQAQKKATAKRSVPIPPHIGEFKSRDTQTSEGKGNTPIAFRACANEDVDAHGNVPVKSHISAPGITLRVCERDFGLKSPFVPDGRYASWGSFISYLDIDAAKTIVQNAKDAGASNILPFCREYVCTLLNTPGFNAITFDELSTKITDVARKDAVKRAEQEADGIEPDSNTAPPLHPSIGIGGNTMECKLLVTPHCVSRPTVEHPFEVRTVDEIIDSLTLVRPDQPDNAKPVEFVATVKNGSDRLAEAFAAFGVIQGVALRKIALRCRKSGNASVATLTVRAVDVRVDKHDTMTIRGEIDTARFGTPYEKIDAGESSVMEIDSDSD